MTNSANLSFNAGILTGDETVPNRQADSRAARQPASEIAAAEAPASLWRATLDEQESHLSDHAIVRGLFGVIAALTLASVAYAAWVTFALMAGGHLENAVSAFLR